MKVEDVIPHTGLIMITAGIFLLFIGIAFMLVWNHNTLGSAMVIIGFIFMMTGYVVFAGKPEKPCKKEMT